MTQAYCVIWIILKEFTKDPLFSLAYQPHTHPTSATGTCCAQIVAPMHEHTISKQHLLIRLFVRTWSVAQRLRYDSCWWSSTICESLR
jgi:hypothetical protein